MDEFKDDQGLTGSGKQSRILSKAEISYIVAIVILAVIVIVVVPTLSVFLIQNNNKINISSQNAPLLLNPKQKTISSSQPVGLLQTTPSKTIFKAELPYTIGPNERLIVKVIRSATYFTSYFVYKYPTGTYNDLESLVDALNTANNSEAIYYDTINFTWFVNSFLYWSISSSGKLQLTWQNPFYDQITFFSTAPIQDPNFNFSKGQGGIDDSTVPPNTSTLINDFGIPVGTIINNGIPVVLSFP